MTTLRKGARYEIFTRVHRAPWEFAPTPPALAVRHIFEDLGFENVDTRQVSDDDARPFIAEFPEWFARTTATWGEPTETDMRIDTDEFSVLTLRELASKTPAFPGAAPGASSQTTSIVTHVRGFTLAFLGVSALAGAAVAIGIWSGARPARTSRPRSRPS